MMGVQPTPIVMYSRALGGERVRQYPRQRAPRLYLLEAEFRRTFAREYDDSGRVVWRGSAKAFTRRERSRVNLGHPANARSFIILDRAGWIKREFAYHGESCPARGPIGPCSCGLRVSADALAMATAGGAQ